MSYTTTDHLGSPRILTDQTGTVISRRDFLPFGEEINPGVGSRSSALNYGTNDNIRQKFTGYERDTETDLDFAQARMSAKSLGRFTSVDPQYFQASMTLDPQRFHLYGYARSNPLKWTDPNGERLFLGGDSKWLLNEGLYLIAGGEESFNAFFHIVDGEVLLNPFRLRQDPREKGIDVFRVHDHEFMFICWRQRRKTRRTPHFFRIVTTNDRRQVQWLKVAILFIPTPNACTRLHPKVRLIRKAAIAGKTIAPIQLGRLINRHPTYAVVNVEPIQRIVQDPQPIARTIHPRA